MARSSVLRPLVVRVHAAGGAPFTEEAPGSGLFSWKTRLGRWPFEFQVDRFALEIRCYLADELFCTGRLPEPEADGLLAPASGPGDPAALAEMERYVDDEVRGDSRRFLRPPHADRHPDRRAEPRHDAAIRPRPARSVDTPS
jgi:hypothetical protein